MEWKSEAIIKISEKREMPSIPNLRHGVSEGWKTAFEYIVTEVQTLMLKEYNHPLSFDLKV